MKRFLSIFMCLVLLLSMSVIFASCDEKDEPAVTTAATTTADGTTAATTTAATTTAATTTAATTTFAAPAGSKLYSDGIIFAYPEEWTENSNGIIASPNGQKNITVSYEDATTMYDNLTADQFSAMFAPMYEQLGWSISNVTAKTVTSNGLSVNVFSFKTTLPQPSAAMIQTIFVVTVGNRTYSVALTENAVDEAIANTILETLRAA
jgi:hypothetical protein